MNVAAMRAGAGARFLSNRAALVYYDSGSSRASPLVVIAGGPGFDAWHMLVGGALEQLASTHRVVCYDQRGTGAASAFDPQFTNEDYVDDIEALRVALETDVIDVLGHSYGGYLAMGYAASYPGRVRRLLLANSVAPKREDTRFIFNEVFPERMHDYRSWRAAVRSGDVDAARRNAGIHVSMLFCDPAKQRAWSEAAADVGFHPLVTAVLWADPSAPDLTAAVGQLRVPTLVMTGRYDMNIPVRVALGIRNAIAGAQLHVFERSGHMPFFEEPGEFVAVVRRFLD